MISNQFPASLKNFVFENGAGGGSGEDGGDREHPLPSLLPLSPAIEHSSLYLLGKLSDAICCS